MLDRIRQRLATPSVEELRATRLRRETDPHPSPGDLRCWCGQDGFTSMYELREHRSDCLRTIGRR